MAGMDYLCCERCGSRLMYCPLTEDGPERPDVVCLHCVEKLEDKLLKTRKRLRKKGGKV